MSFSPEEIATVIVVAPLALLWFGVRLYLRRWCDRLVAAKLKQIANRH